MAFQVSPGVAVSEIDLTTSIPAVSFSTGAIAGYFSWGPALVPTQVSSETQLLQIFGRPTPNSAGSFISAANFLAYGNDLRVTRVQASGATNAVANTAVGSVVIPNEQSYQLNQYSTATNNPFTARYLGSLGNALEVVVFNAKNWTANTISSTDPLYQYATTFDYAPSTSPYAVSKGAAGANDEVHVVIVDRTGQITGTPGGILEKYPHLSVLLDAKAPDGSANYYKEVLFQKSKWIHWTGHPVANANPVNWGNTIAQYLTSSTTLALDTTPYVANLSTGTSGVVATANVIDGYNTFSNTEAIDVSLIMAGDLCGFLTAGDATDAVTLTSTVIQTAENRADAVALVSPMLANVQTSTGVETSVTNFASAVYASSYAIMDSGWKYQYDKYADTYRWIPLNADVAGLCARTDYERDPWYSPAGLNRGSIKNLVRLAFNPSKTQRDTLYKAGVNPVVSFPGEGTVLFGDKTLQNRPSAFDRINVRRLFIVLEKAISRAARGSLFEFNDDFTRSQFVNLVEPFLRTVQGRRGIYNYRVVCDGTNNTPAIIDANAFVGDIYIQPAKSINFIQLNFIATRTGVSFDEIVGKF